MAAVRTAQAEVAKTTIWFIADDEAELAKKSVDATVSCPSIAGATSDSISCASRLQSANCYIVCHNGTRAGTGVYRSVSLPSRQRERRKEQVRFGIIDGTVEFSTYYLAGNHLHRDPVEPIVSLPSLCHSAIQIKVRLDAVSTYSLVTT